MLRGCRIYLSIPFPGMIVQGFTNVGLSTLEKQFKLNSKESGTIVAAKEISSLLLIAFLSYYGSFGHKPKYLAVGALVTAFGSLLYVLPHLLIGKYIPDEDANIFKNRDVCMDVVPLNSTLESARCHVLGQSEWYYMFTFISAKLLLGAGTAPLFTLGAAYIDENVKPKVAPVYLGIWYATIFFGPGVGFVAGGSMLNVYVDLIQVCFIVWIFYLCFHHQLSIPSYYPQCPLLRKLSLRIASSERFRSLVKISRSRKRRFVLITC